MANNTRRIFIRVTEEEYKELLRQKAFMHLPSYSSLIRMYINNAVCFNVNLDGMFELSTQISRIGNNINQIAKKANETQTITPYQMQIVQSEMSKVSKAVADINDKYVEITKYIARKTNGGGNLGNYEDYQD